MRLKKLMGILVTVSIFALFGNANATSSTSLPMDNIEQGNYIKFLTNINSPVLEKNIFGDNILVAKRGKKEKSEKSEKSMKSKKSNKGKMKGKNKGKGKKRGMDR